MRLLIHCLGRLDFLHLSILAALRFYKNCLNCEASVVVNLMYIFTMTSEFKYVCLEAGLWDNLSTCPWSHLRSCVTGSFTDGIVIVMIGCY